MVRGKVLVPIALAIGAAAMALAALVARFTHHSAGMLTRDIRALGQEAGAQLPFYAGALSQLNIMVWAAAGSLAVLVGYLEPLRRRWLLTFAVLLFVLAADDALMLHESGTSQEIPEVALVVPYAVTGLLLLRDLTRRKVEDSTIAFLIGGVLLAASVILDQAVGRVYLLEDTPKLLGSLVWLTVPPLSLRPPSQEDDDTRQLT